MSGVAQTEAQLNSAFANAGAGSITPQTMLDLVASVTIVPGGIGYALTATGVALGSAFQITQTLSYFTTVGSGTGAALPLAGNNLGTEFLVWNAGGNSLTLYATTGDVIGVPGSFGASATISANAWKSFIAISPGIWVEKVHS